MAFLCRLPFRLANSSAGHPPHSLPLKANDLQAASNVVGDLAGMMSRHATKQLEGVGWRGSLIGEINLPDEPLIQIDPLGAGQV